MLTWMFLLLLVGGAGQETFLEFQDDGEFSVEVVATDGQLLPGVTVTLDPESNDELGDISAITDSSGKVYLELPAPGVYSLRIQLEGFVGVRLGPFEVDAFAQPSRTILRDLQVVMNPTLEY